MIRVAVAPGKFARGVEAPGTPWRTHDPAVHGHPTYDWRAEPGSEANTARVVPDFEVLPLEAALARRYDTDAHLVTYVLHDRATGAPVRRQPRVNKGGIAWLTAEGLDADCEVLFCDVDNPGHADWTAALRAELDRQLAELPVLATCGVYLTAHGYRLVQPLDEPVGVGEVERYIDAWLDELEAAGVAADTHCRDWTRHYRLPHVRRGGRETSSPIVSLERMRPRVISPKYDPGGPRRGPEVDRARKSVRCARIFRPGGRSAPLCSAERSRRSRRVATGSRSPSPPSCSSAASRPRRCQPSSMRRPQRRAGTWPRRGITAATPRTRSAGTHAAPRCGATSPRGSSPRSTA